jgi:hypothetical protein
MKLVGQLAYRFKKYTIERANLNRRVSETHTISIPCPLTTGLFILIFQARYT